MTLRALLRIPFSACLVLGALVLHVVALPGAAHAQGIFLDFQNNVPGESTVAGFEDWIEITSLGSEVMRASTSSKPQVSQISLTKRTDRASPILWRDTFVSTNRGDAHLVVVDDQGEQLFEIVLENAIVMSYSLGTSGGAASEQLTLQFTSIRYAYYPPDGGATVVTCWNVAAEMSC